MATRFLRTLTRSIALAAPLACGAESPSLLPFPFPSGMSAGQTELLVVDRGDAFEAFVHEFGTPLRLPVTVSEDERLRLEAFVYDFAGEWPVGRIDRATRRAPAGVVTAQFGEVGGGEFRGWEEMDETGGRFAELTVPESVSCPRFTVGRAKDLSIEPDMGFLLPLDDERAVAGYDNGKLFLVETPFVVTEIEDFAPGRLRGGFLHESQLMMLGDTQVERVFIRGREVSTEPFGPSVLAGDDMHWGVTIDAETIATLSSDGTVELVTTSTRSVLFAPSQEALGFAKQCGGIAAETKDGVTTIIAARGRNAHAVVLTLAGGRVRSVDEHELTDVEIDQVCSVGQTEVGVLVGTSGGELFRFDGRSREWVRVPFANENRLLISSIAPLGDSFVIAAGPFLAGVTKSAGVCPIDQRVTEASLEAMTPWGDGYLIGFDPSDAANQQLAMVSIDTP